MVLTVVLLDSDEQFIEFLDTELLDITETTQEKSIRSCDFTYEITNLNHAKEVFKMGNKLWVSGGEPTIQDCLYVIPEKINFNLFQENRITFTIEEVLVELNFVPFFSQTVFSQSNLSSTFNLVTTNGVPNVIVTRKALEFWFGDYFDIGIFQSCLSERLSQIAPTGTMTLMALLRFIEEQTSNVFVTRYEKDPQENRINRYLDFLNPNSSSLSWDLKAEFEFYDEDSPNDLTISGETVVSETIEEDDDIVTFPEFQNPSPLDFDNLILNFRKDSTVLSSFDLSSEGLTGNAEIYTFLVSYSNSEMVINITGKSMNITSTTISTQKNPTAPTYTTLESTTISDTVDISNGSVFEIVDSSNGKIVYSQKINPLLGNVQPQVLDLGYNTEDIDYEIDESDTYNAIAPVITLSDSTDSNSLTRADYNKLINRWINLSVEKGVIVPMIIQKVTSSVKPSNRSASVIDSAYWNRPLKPNDQTDSDDKTYEYLEGTAYWKAPFSKKAGEIFVADDSDTGIDYKRVLGKQNNHNLVKSTPKIGPVETSDEDPYAIFNDVCMKLKDKRYPAINVKASVANFVNGFNNNYGVYDKVFLKVPGVSTLVSAKVVKTVKNPKNVLENTVELDSYSVSSKAVQIDTEIIAENIQLKYPNKKKLNATLLDNEGNSLSDKLITFAVSKVEDSGTSFVKSYIKKTNSNGIATLNFGLKPGNYTVDITFGGDVTYSSSANSISANVSGTVKKSENTKNSASKKTKTVTKKITQYFDKFGVSPDKKYIMAVGLPSAPGDLGKYGYKHWETVFVNWCPHCGKATLHWGYRFGTHFRGRAEGGSYEGIIICENCDADYSAISGREHVETNAKYLKVYKKAKKSSHSRAQKLKNGKIEYQTITKEVKVKKVTSTKTRTMVSRSSYPKSQSAKVSESVKSKALSVVGNSTGIPAAKKIIKWVAEHIKWEDRNDFYQSPATTLKRKKGNCCTQADLAAQMLDAAGVCHDVDVRYVHVHKPGRGHVFLRINKTYADPVKKSNSWGHYITGYGKPGSGRITKYPNLPFDRSY